MRMEGGRTWRARDLAVLFLRVGTRTRNFAPTRNLPTREEIQSDLGRSHTVEERTDTGRVGVRINGRARSTDNVCRERFGHHC